MKTPTSVFLTGTKRPNKRIVVGLFVCFFPTFLYCRCFSSNLLLGERDVLLGV